ncbi:MAG: glycosyltransferase family 2 protein [Chloroflexi bacterium]|nr:glycosyltransferase family 2 protein [Chloroflexota bacterium]
MSLSTSVVVPAYNAVKVLPVCLAALEHQTHRPDEIIVVDDGSSDETEHVARRCGATVVKQSHQGPAAARNLGIQRARGDVILFTDADCEPLPDWVEKMIAPFSDPQVTGAKGAYRTRQQKLMARLVQMEYERRYERMRALPRIDFIDTYSAAYRRSVLIQYGGFDCAYPIPSAEDIDLSFRLAVANHLLVFVPEARVWHLHPTSLKTYLTRKGQYGLWRALAYLRHPEKTSGDAHTDPALKSQFVLVAAALAFFLAGVIWQPLFLVGLIPLALFEWSILPFVRWAWPRDRVVALVWSPISFARVTVQGMGLALGLIWHGLLARQNLRPAETVSLDGHQAHKDS